MLQPNCQHPMLEVSQVRIAAIAGFGLDLDIVCLAMKACKIWNILILWLPLAKSIYQRESNLQCGYGSDE